MAKGYNIKADKKNIALSTTKPWTCVNVHAGSGMVEGYKLFVSKQVYKQSYDVLRQWWVMIGAIFVVKVNGPL